MRTKCDVKIAGEFTVADWKNLKEKLIVGRPDNWKQAYEEFFMRRLETRYLDPIQVLNPPLKKDSFLAKSFC